MSQHDAPEVREEAPYKEIVTENHQHMATATAPTSNHVIDSLDKELIILQKRNQLIELQNKRTQLMEQTPMSFNPKYPVM